MAIIATSEGQRATGMKMRRSLGRCRIAIASVCAGSPFQDIPALADTPALPAAAARAAAGGSLATLLLSCPWVPTASTRGGYSGDEMI